MADGPDLEDRVAALEATLGPAADFALLPLRPDEIRQLLRECVTVVKPGETLVVRVPVTLEPEQVRQYQEILNADADAGVIPFRVLVIACDDLRIVEPDESGKLKVAVTVQSGTDADFLARLKRAWPEIVRWEMRRRLANRQIPKCDDRQSPEGVPGAD